MDKVFRAEQQMRTGRLIDLMEKMKSLTLCREICTMRVFMSKMDKAKEWTGRPILSKWKKFFCFIVVCKLLVVKFKDRWIMQAYCIHEAQKISVKSAFRNSWQFLWFHIHGCCFRKLLGMSKTRGNLIGHKKVRPHIKDRSLLFPLLRVSSISP